MRKAIVALAALVVVVSCKTDTHNGAQTLGSDSSAVGLNPFDSITQLINEDPENAELVHARAAMFLEAGELSVALGDAGRAIMLDSSKAEYFLTISDIYFKGRKPAQCLASLKTAGELEPNNIEVPLRLAEFYLYIQNYTEAVKATNDALKADNKSDRAYFLKGICYKEVGDTAKSAEQFLRTLENNPDHVDAYVELEILYDIKGDPIAEQYYRNALKVDSDSKEALYGLGIHLQDFDRLNEAMEVYTELVQKYPDHASAMYNMGFINYEFIKDHKMALKYFDQAVNTNPDYVAAIYMRGLCYEAIGDVARAKAEYQFALEKDATFSLALNGLERLL